MVSHKGENGENVGEAFLKLILEEKKRILKILEEIKPKILSRNEKSPSNKLHNAIYALIHFWVWMILKDIR